MTPSFFTKANIIMGLWAFDQLDGSNIRVINELGVGSCSTDAPGVFVKRHHLGERFFKDMIIVDFLPSRGLYMPSCIAVCLQTLLMHICGRVMVGKYCTTDIYTLGTYLMPFLQFYMRTACRTHLYSPSVLIRYGWFLVLELLNHD